MAKQVVFGNTKACAALAMPESFLITNNSQKKAFVYGFLGLSAHKKPICTQFTHLSISRCGGSCWGGGEIYTTHEVTKYNSISSDEEQSCSMQTEKVPKHTGNN